MVRKTVIEDAASADWTKATWDLPPYKSPAFMEDNPDLVHFRTLLVYKDAVRMGLIVNDEWAGPITDAENEEAFAEEFQATLELAAMQDDDTEYDAAKDIETDGN